MNHEMPPGNESATERSDAPPIACGLDARSLSQRLAEWQALMATAVSSMEADATSVRLTLHDSDDALLAAATLGRRETECCPFFDVAVELEPTRRVLRLSVPAGAEPVLAEFVSVLRS
jgi:hypothetical protein